MFAPFAILQFRRNIEGHVVLAVWILGALAIGATSAMSRFLLPLLPIALAASIAGIALATQSRWRILRGLALLSLGGFIFAGFAAMLFIRVPRWPSLRATTRQKITWLQFARLPASEFVNREVAGPPS
jgi:hypothetical protein